MKYNEYSLTFDQIHNSFRESYANADARARGVEGLWNKNAARLREALGKLFETVARYADSPEHRYAIAHAVNEFNEANDTLKAYLLNTTTRRPDKVLETLSDVQRDAFATLCELFGVREGDFAADVLFDAAQESRVVDNRKKETEKC